MAAMNFTKDNLIEAVRRFPCLYDTTMKEYKDDLVWENAWKLICIELIGKEYDDNELLSKGKGTMFHMEIFSYFFLFNTYIFLLLCTYISYLFIFFPFQYLYNSTEDEISNLL